MNLVLRKSFLLTLVYLINVGCGDDDMSKDEDSVLKNVSVEIIFFEFIADTGNNSNRLRYEIKFVNPNNINVRGSHAITTNADGLITTQVSSTNSPCTEIEASSECTISYDEEGSLDLGTINFIELVSAEYTLAE